MSRDRGQGQVEFLVPNCDWGWVEVISWVKFISQVVIQVEVKKVKSRTRELGWVRFCKSSPKSESESRVRSWLMGIKISRARFHIGCRETDTRLGSWLGVGSQVAGTKVVFRVRNWELVHGLGSWESISSRVGGWGVGSRGVKSLVLGRCVRSLVLGWIRESRLGSVSSV